MAKSINLYHSKLVQMENPLRVTVKSDILKSKFKKNGADSFYVLLEIDGQLYSYTPENQACEDALRGRNGQTISISAEGSRDAATIVVVASHGGAPANTGQQQQRQNAGPSGGQQQQRTPPQNNSRQQTDTGKAEKPEHAAMMFIGRNQSLVHIATRAAIKSTSELKGLLGETYSQRFYEEYLLECLRCDLFGSSGAGVTLNLPVGIPLELPKK